MMTGDELRERLDKGLTFPNGVPNVPQEPPVAPEAKATRLSKAARKVLELAASHPFHYRDGAFINIGRGNGTALMGLERKGFVKTDDNRIYEITDAGKAALKAVVK